MQIDGGKFDYEEFFELVNTLSEGLAPILKKKHE
jgi:hypothetical protein